MVGATVITTSTTSCHYLANGFRLACSPLLLFQILKTKKALVETRFGTATVLAYPAKSCLVGKGKEKGTELRAPKRFVEVSWSPF